MYFPPKGAVYSHWEVEMQSSSWRHQTGGQDPKTQGPLFFQVLSHVLGFYLCQSPKGVPCSQRLA